MINVDTVLFTIACITTLLIVSSLPYDLSDAFLPGVCVLLEPDDERKKRHARMKKQHIPMCIGIIFLAWCLGMLIYFVVGN